MDTGTIIAILVVVFILLMIIITNIRVVPQAHAFIIERLGAYTGTWGVGLHVKVPFIDKVAKNVLLKEQVADFPPQPVITKDNVTMSIDTVVFFQITDPKLFAYGVENPMIAIENLTATTLRNIIGELELDQTLTSRETINAKMRSSLDLATDPWGIKVNRVELKNIMPPAAIRYAMEKQMKAERERREAILKAEGEKKSTILVAEGKKESAILEAEAEKAAAILNAEAQKEAMIRKAEGEAEAILKVQQANAEGIKLLNESAPTEAILRIKSLEAFEKAADGKATKIIIPSEIQGIAGLAKSIKEDLIKAKAISDVAILYQTVYFFYLSDVQFPSQYYHIRKLRVKLQCLDIGYVKLCGEMHLHTNFIAIGHYCYVACDDSCYPRFLCGIHYLAHHIKVFLIDDGVHCQVCLYTMLCAGCGNLPQVINGELISGMGAHVKLSDAEIHRVSTCLNGCCQ